MIAVSLCFLLYCTFLVEGWRYLERLGGLNRARVFLALRRKRWTLAEACATRSLNERRTLPRYRLACLIGRACSYAQRGFIREALEDCDRALAVQPNFVAGLCLKGALLCDTGRHKEAIEPLLRATQVSPKSSEAYLALAAAAREAGRLDDCEQALTAYLTLKPRESSMLRLRAEIRTEQGRYQGALADFEKLTREFTKPMVPSFMGSLKLKAISSRLHLAIHLITLGRNEEAVFWAGRHLVECGDCDAAGNMTMALALTGLNEHQRAIASCDRILTETLSPFALWLRGTNAWVIGDMARAERDIELAAAIDLGRTPAVGQLWREFRAQTGPSRPGTSPRIAIN